MSFFTKLSLANRSIVALASIAVLLFGFLVVPLMKQEYLPSSLTQSMIAIVSVYPGAVSTQVEQDVTNPLEQVLQGLQGVAEMSSQSSAGISTINLTFTSSTDLDKAKQSLRDQISQVQANLPSGVTPHLQTFSVSDLPIVTLAVTSEQDLQTTGFMLKQKIIPRIQGISGVSRVYLTGMRQQIVSITLNLPKLQAQGISVSQVRQALQANNITMPAGEVSNNGQNLAIRVSNSFSSLADLENLVISTSQNMAQAPASATAIKLNAIASVQEDLAPSNTLIRVNGQPGLSLAITKTTDGSTVAISQALRAKLAEFEKISGQNTQFTIIDDQAPAIENTLSDLTREGLLGAGLAILVILLFLLSIRSTLVTAIAIPLSVIIALIALWAQGSSLNALTLSGLTVAVGRLVDDAIVVLENIYRHLDYPSTSGANFRDKRSAILDGVKEVATAVTGSTFTTIAVFLPLAFIGGVVGEQTQPLALAVTFALLASLLVALTIIPVLAYWFMKTPKSINKQSERISILERTYLPLISWVTRHRLITVILAILLLVGSFALFPFIPVNPVVNQSLTPHSFVFTQQLPASTNLTQTSVAAQKIEVLLGSTPGIQTYQVTFGTSDTGLSPASNSATFTVLTNVNTNIVDVEQYVHNHLNTIRDIGMLAFVDTGSNNVAVTVQAPDGQTLDQAASEVLKAMQHIPQSGTVTSDLTEDVPLIEVQVDPARASQHELTVLQVGQLLQTVYTGTIATQVTLQDTRQSVEIKLPAAANSVQQMQALLLPGPQGSVRLSDVANVIQANEPVQITHENGLRAATITVPIIGQNYSMVLNEVQKRLNTLHLPNAAQANLSAATTLQQDVINRMILALALAIPTVFIVLVLTLRSLLQPLILLVTIPFAAVGSIILTVVTRTAIGTSTLFGFLMLIGIVVTNAIVLIDRVNYYRTQGLDARAAVIAGGQRRVRPILMTAIVTIIALIPMAVSGTGNAVVSSSLAIVVIGGLTSSTFLTLLFVPTLYVLLENAKDRLSKQQSTLGNPSHVGRDLRPIT